MFNDNCNWPLLIFTKCFDETNKSCNYVLFRSVALVSVIDKSIDFSVTLVMTYRVIGMGWGTDFVFLYCRNITTIDEFSDTRFTFTLLSLLLLFSAVLFDNNSQFCYISSTDRHEKNYFKVYYWYNFFRILILLQTRMV